LDITANQFNLIDFSEASAFINIMPILGTHIELYDPAQTDSFLKNQQNESVVLQRQWAFKPEDSISVYELDCISDWPAGACYLAIASKGQVQLTYEISDCIPARKFVLEPQKYSQSGWKNATVAKPDLQQNPSPLKREQERIKG
jgi:hypothetical protein